MEAKETRIQEIDGLRGIAILAVLIYHGATLFLSPFFPGIGGSESLSLLAYGVDLFFVISGFLIGTILLKIDSLSGMKTFYIRRITRIWPLYYLLLFVVNLTLPDRAYFAKVPYWSFFFFVFNFWESFGKGLHPMLVQLWSVAVEEQFYMLGPVLFTVFNRKQLSSILLGYLFLAPWLRLVLLYKTNIVVWRFTPARMDGICVGLLLALFLSSEPNISFIADHLKFFKRLAFLLLSLLLPAKLLLPGPLWASFGQSLLVLAFGCALLVVQTQCSLHQKMRLLSWGVLRYLGLRCYSIYLFHIFFSHLANGMTDNLYLRPILGTALILGFAHLSWRYIEMPFINLGRKFSYRKSSKLDQATP